ncbi:hypothetical protein HDC90_004808 [Pedobacter sp. AK013]|uniref:hypothetical protein n=1 Tax=Pedobacter sp. AK013 TaxID=2723071 RepID=UPI001614476C|nr:hypothetical protein [Pedobacter sp. AK013]MBB6240144.1 hypothetical protein [Pedobacter sp. AK013]
MKSFLLLLLSTVLFSCNQNGKDSSTAVKKAGLNLEKINFKENPLEFLKSKIDSNVNHDSDYVRKGYSMPFEYPVGYKLEPWNGKHSFYGKAYYSKIIDSIAYYQNIYFNRIAFLTHNNKTVAILADAEIKSDTVYNEFVKQLEKQFGKPTFSPQTTEDVFYEWSAKDRRIQIDYSKGFSMEAISGKKMDFKQTFNMQMLIFNRADAAQIDSIQQKNYARTKEYKVMQGDFKLYKNDPQKNIVLMDSILYEKFK